MTGSTYIPFHIAQKKGMNLIKTGENPVFGLFIVCGINLGLRVNVLSTLDFDQLKSESTVIKEPKTGKTRKVLINNNIRKALEHFTDEYSYINGGKAFVSQKGTVFSTRQLNRLMQKHFSGPRISTHSLRKTFGRRVWEVNGETDKALIYLSNIFEHSSTEVTRTYLGIKQEEIDSIYDSL